MTYTLKRKPIYFDYTLDGQMIERCVWFPQYVTHKRAIESTQKQFVIFLNGDDQDRADNDYVLEPYIDRCIELNLDTLVRRRTNACRL